MEMLTLTLVWCVHVACDAMKQEHEALSFHVMNTIESYISRELPVGEPGKTLDSGGFRHMLTPLSVKCVSSIHNWLVTKATALCRFPASKVSLQLTKKHLFLVWM